MIDNYVLLIDEFSSKVVGVKLIKSKAWKETQQICLLVWKIGLDSYAYRASRAHFSQALTDH